MLKTPQRYARFVAAELSGEVPIVVVTPYGVGVTGAKPSLVRALAVDPHATGTTSLASRPQSSGESRAPPAGRSPRTCRRRHPSPPSPPAMTVSGSCSRSSSASPASPSPGSASSSSDAKVLERGVGRRSLRPGPSASRP